MKKLISYFTLICILAALLISCSNSSKPITVNHSIDKVPFALSMKVQPFDGLGEQCEELTNLSDMMDKCFKKKKEYFIIIKNHERLMDIVDESCHDDFVKSNLSTLGNDFFKDNRLFAVFSYGDVGTYLKIDEIVKNKKTLTIYLIPSLAHSDASMGVDCCVIGVSSEYAEGITDIKLEFTDKYIS